MFDWLKRSKPSAAQPLYFKDAQAAFAYACEFLQSELSAGAVLPALVLDAAAAIGGGVAVKRQPDGNQIAMLRVCSRDGGYVVIASSATPNGPSLQPGHLVAWQAGAPIAAMESQFPDPRSCWGGLVVAKLQPEYTAGRGWAIAQAFAR